MLFTGISVLTFLNRNIVFAKLGFFEVTHFWQTKHPRLRLISEWVPIV
jgi:hypothetical protein